MPPLPCCGREKLFQVHRCSGCSAGVIQLDAQADRQGENACGLGQLPLQSHYKCVSGADVATTAIKSVSASEWTDLSFSDV